MKHLTLYYYTEAIAIKFLVYNTTAKSGMLKLQ